MKSLLGFLLMSSLAQAGYPPPPGPWTMGAWRPVPDPLWLGEAIQANGGRFWLGKPPSANCPADVPDLDCAAYPGSSTVLNGGNGTLFLSVGVPGGQEVYIAPDGALGYTTAHSASVPEGSILTGWTREISNSGGAPTVLGNAGRPIMGCPAGEGVYQVFLKVDDSQRDPPCISFGIRTYRAAGTVAWQY